MPIVLFEDAAVAGLAPASLARAAFSICCGASRLIEVARGLEQPISAVVRPYLRAIVEADHRDVSTGIPPSSGELVLLVNARTVPSAAAGHELNRLLSDNEPGVVHIGDSVAAALLPPAAAAALVDAPGDELPERIDALALPELGASLSLLEYPHEIVRYHLHTMGENLAARLATAKYREVSDKFFVAEGVALSKHLEVDVSAGPILLEEGVNVGPFTFLKGPIHIDRRTRINEHTALKDCVAIGPSCKIGGEVEAAIIEAFTNKQHDGFLGHSYLGSWINLGAGTCNSDLKNTYGKVAAQYDGQRVDTEMQFFGAIIGDYAKTAIATSIFTGKLLGVCSMAYGAVTTNVPSFTNYAKQFGQITAAPVEVLIETQARMFARRNVTQRPCDIQLLRDLYDQTAAQRDPAKIPIAPLTFEGPPRT